MRGSTNRGTIRRGRVALSAVAVAVCTITALPHGAASADSGDAGGVRQTGVERVSVAAEGTQANDDSSDASITPAGHRVVFSSYANNLTPGDTGRNEEVFVRELATGQNRQFGGYPLAPPMLSSDGQVLAYLGPRFNNMALYQHHLSVGWSAAYTCSLRSCEAAMGSNDRHQAFSVTFRHPETNQRIEVSNPDTGGLQTVDVIHNTAPSRPSISSDGTRLAYQDGGEQDVFLWDRADNTPAGPIEGPGKAAELVQLSDDGNKVVYRSGPDTYVHDVASGTAAPVPGVKGVAIDPTGRYLLHTPSGATGPAPLTLRDLETGTDETVTDRPASAGVDAVSTGGRHVVFESAAEGIVPNDTNGKTDIFLRTLR
ncbi:hypothetical protein ACH41E_24105 [Streptomyces sp. NPDC020412]|uniref:hypothetical protein n=1 Tax=Streptomyces sp. NPDC020412 TaxID=3365073 RepID=UPI00379C4B9A